MMIQLVLLAVYYDHNAGFHEDLDFYVNSHHDNSASAFDKVGLCGMHCSPMCPSTYLLEKPTNTGAVVIVMALLIMANYRLIF